MKRGNLMFLMIGLMILVGETILQQNGSISDTAVLILQIVSSGFLLAYIVDFFRKIRK